MKVYSFHTDSTINATFAWSGGGHRTGGIMTSISGPGFSGTVIPVFKMD